MDGTERARGMMAEAGAKGVSRDVTALGATRTLTTVKGGAGSAVGWLALNASSRPRAVGGIRCTPDLDARKVSALADAMSWKFAWLGMPMGGAKAGLIEAPEWTTDTRREAIRAFGRALGPQLRSRMYGAGTDMGFGPEDLWEFQVGAGRVSGPPPPPSQRGDTGEATALTLAGMLAEAGVRVTSVSNRFTAVHDEAGLDIPTIRKLRAERGDEGLESYESGTRIEHAELLEMPVDVLIPCAAHWSLNPENADRLQCGSVVSAANCPISPDLGESGLERRGILVVPDFVANSGGILYANIPASDAGRREILRTLYPAAVARLFQVADQTGGSVTDLARAAAVRRTRTVQNDVERARREMEELDRAFARRRSRMGRRLRGESEGRALARRWLDPGRLA
ncbi:MAG: Glu/Leu/Phe/Val dehydrogenase dimerization domain-containing protein [Gemmatimonadota bacterium]